MSLTVIAATTASLIAGGLFAHFGAAAASSVLSAASKIKRSPEQSFSNHFRNIRYGGSHLVVMTVTARPHLPVTDLLYFELISHLLTKKLTKAALITIWWPRDILHESTTADHGLDWTLPYLKYIKKLSDRHAAELTIIHQRSDGRPESRQGAPLVEPTMGAVGDAGLPAIFWRALKQVTSKEYYSWVRSLNIRARHLRHLVRARPAEQVLEGVVAHTIHNSLLAPLVLGRLEDFRSNGSDELVLSVVFWELEVDRLAVYFQLYDEQKNATQQLQFDLNPIAGRTIKNGSRRPSDNHTPSLAISMATPISRQLENFQRRSNRETRAYTRAIRTILKLNYGLDPARKLAAEEGRRLTSDWHVAERTAKIRRISNPACELVYLADMARKEVLSS